MIIYLDYLFIENVIFDFIILKEVSKLAKIKSNNKRIFLATIVSSIYVVIMLLFKLKELNYFISKILLAFVTVYIAFKPEKPAFYIKLILLFFTVSIVNIGALIVLKSLLGISELSGISKIVIYVFVYLIGELIVGRLWKLYSSEVTKDNLNYTVILKVDGKNYEYEGFLDTGNTVYSHGMPVIFAEVFDERIETNLKDKEYFEVKTVTLGSISSKKAYVFDDIQIIGKNERWCVKAGVVFETSKIAKYNNYNMILNYILYTESMGGIKIWD